MLLVASSFPIGQAITDALPPVVLIWLRFLLGSLLFLPILLWRDLLVKPSCEDILRYSFLSIPLVVFFWCMFEALRYTSALNTGATYTLVPAMTAVFALWLNREAISYKRTASLMLGIMGALWIVFRGDKEALLALQLNYGDWIFLLGCLFMAATSPLVKRFHRGEPLMQLTFWQLLLGSVWLLLASLLSDVSIEWQQIDQQLILGLLYLTLFTTLLTFLIFNICTIKLGASKVTAYTLLTPLMVLGLEWVMGGNQIEWSLLPGMAMLVIAMFVIQKDSQIQRDL